MFWPHSNPLKTHHFDSFFTKPNPSFLTLVFHYAKPLVLTLILTCLYYSQPPRFNPRFDSFFSLFVSLPGVPTALADRAAALARGVEAQSQQAKQLRLSIGADERALKEAEERREQPNQGGGLWRRVV